VWNYRIVRKKILCQGSNSHEEHWMYSYGIHEAYYDLNGKVGAITDEPEELWGDTIEELRHSWMGMVEAFGLPVLDYDDIPEPGYDANSDPMSEMFEDDETEDEDEESGYEDDEDDFEDERCECCCDHEDNALQEEEDRIAQEEIHRTQFVGIDNAKELVGKILDDFTDWIKHIQLEHDEPDQLN